MKYYDGSKPELGHERPLIHYLSISLLMLIGVLMMQSTFPRSLVS